MNKYVELTTENFDATIKEGVTFVDFWAPWCGPCRMIAPIIEELATDFEGTATIAKINTDEQQELATKHSIKSIPCILIFKDGVEVEKITGANSKEFFTNSINKHL